VGSGLKISKGKGGGSVPDLNGMTLPTSFDQLPQFLGQILNTTGNAQFSTIPGMHSLGTMLGSMFDPSKGFGAFKGWGGK
jgi:hypothetical protein